MSLFQLLTLAHILMKTQPRPRINAPCILRIIYFCPNTTLHSPFPIVLISGPLWLFQLWLNGVFEDELNTTVPREYHHGIAGRQLSCWTLSMYKARHFEEFWRFYDLFYHLDSNNKSISPFSSRTFGSQWFTRPLSLSRDLIWTWKEFLTQTLLQASLFEEESRYVFYHPGFVARQFGLCQLLPTTWFLLTSSLFERKLKILRRIFICSKLLQSTRAFS